MLYFDVFVTLILTAAYVQNP